MPLHRAQTAIRLATTIAGLCLAAAASANTDPLSDLLSVPGSAGLGFVTRVERSPYLGGGTRYDLLPLYLYEGDRLFLHASRAGVKLFKDDAQRVDLFLDRRFEGYPVENVPASLLGMAERSASIDLGLSYRYRQPWGTLQAELLHDVGGASNGNEFRVSYSYDWRSGRLALRSSLTVAARDAKLNDYYYGVLPGEATAARPAYAPGAGVNTSLALYGSYGLTERWRLLGGVSVTMLNHRITDSPIVPKGAQPALFIGAAYDFGSYRKPWAEERSPTYVKLLHGTVSDDACTLVRIITLRCTSTANVNVTTITGVQIGKPFIERLNGWPLDLVGYLGLTYHDEHGLQPNSLQVDAFMKAYYDGFPWSHRVRTRLGLGVGLSLAQRVPYVEVVSQAQRGRTTSRLLNYLDPTIDFSVGDLIGSRVLKDTYLGVGVSHRSGIFGTSNLLGNVNGGSNFIYTYLESIF
ncbi:MipA/OmpV family protein [Variovorax terrae]|uniref:MipA/OmpV family protein n=1 Tax=Variovorax terrae TaxID=2923278 RepID=A0A9X1VYW5_9BURK|nr:MipA/OmpV family protein [Variovorax terrae]MCJ0765910.1 MipA/OmpV family protein [Variovorax terrae]